MADDTQEILEQEITLLISKLSGVKGENIKADTRLREDLGIDGDDAVEIFNELMSRFNVNCDSFVIENYFLDEWFVSMKPFLWLFKSKRLKNKNPITIRHLIGVVKKGRWFESPE